MTDKYKVSVVSNYIYEPDPDKPYAKMGKKNRWINGFVTGLIRNKSGLSEFELDFIRLPEDPAEVASMAARLREQGCQLTICPGTDGAIRWSRANEAIPTLYFGAHPDNHGLELVHQRNFAGVRLNLPLIWEWERFRLLTQVLPMARRLYVPLNLNSEFAFPGIRTVYGLHRARNESMWIPGGSPYLGYRGVYFMCQRLGIDYFEGPYTSPEELDAGLATIERGPESIVLGFNDTLLMPGAPEVLFRHTRASELPLAWVNNAAIISAEGVMDFSSDFQRIGQVLAGLALMILRDGKSMDEVGYHPDPGVRSLLNTVRLEALGVSVDEAMRKAFDDVQ
ncbi:type 1 periplasmic-binding domain-containing protein [Paraliomyxa miuraensis]|uniref:hypothetical protein n=1 Tax=Paraliomyxa miuraensis TaxID=376150 RepID=UPI00225626D6|nr:hypothetical protein [Paraliomyxa miuraensis]MCX4243003.1 hypothetical protein [Paraliomyxa miuraensis]